MPSRKQPVELHRRELLAHRVGVRFDEHGIDSPVTRAHDDVQHAGRARAPVTVTLPLASSVATSVSGRVGELT